MIRRRLLLLLNGSAAYRHIAAGDLVVARGTVSASARIDGTVTASARIDGKVSVQ